MPDPFEIVVGTYEQFLLGYKVNNIVNEYKMERTFATHNHTSSVRSVASDKHYLASGGADDSVYLYDMRYRIESGRLMHHNDTVNCIAFTPEASHLFTCSNDGTIAAIKCGNWQMEKHWQKAHKGLGVNTLAIHPTGKIALSTGADGILRTWNLIKGRQAYATNLVPRLKLDAKNVNILKWSPNGEKYLLAVNRRIDVYSVELAGIGSEIKFNAKIVCVEFLRDDLIAVGLENGQIKFYDLEKSVQTLEAIAHDTRVKCMAFKDDLLVTASSSGEIKLWRYGKHKLRMLQNVNCGARITCLSLAMPFKNLYDDATIKAEEEEEVPRKNRFKVGQEVIVEKEGDWEINSIAGSGKEFVKQKSKKKRSIEEARDSNATDSKKNKSLLKKKKSEDDTIDDAPKKRNKLSDNDNANVTSNKNERKKKRSISVEENNNSEPTKKLKTAKKNIVESNTVTFNGTKVNWTRSKEIDKQDVVRPKRKKEISAEESGTILKKKKKKQ